MAEPVRLATAERQRVVFNDIEQPTAANALYIANLIRELNRANFPYVVYRHTMRPGDASTAPQFYHDVVLYQPTRSSGDGGGGGGRLTLELVRILTLYRADDIRVHENGQLSFCILSSSSSSSSGGGGGGGGGNSRIGKGTWSSVRYVLLILAALALMLVTQLGAAILSVVTALWLLPRMSSPSPPPLTTHCVRRLLRMVPCIVALLACALWFGTHAANGVVGGGGGGGGTARYITGMSVMGSVMWVAARGLLLRLAHRVTVL